MGAEIPHKIKVRITFETTFDWDAVTETAAVEEFNAALQNGSVDIGDLDLDATTAKVEAIWTGYASNA